MAYSPTGVRRILLSRAAAATRRQAVDVPRRERDDSALPIAAAHERREGARSSPRSATRRRSTRTFVPAMKITFGTSGSRASASSSSRSQRIVSMPCCSSAACSPGQTGREARHTNHPVRSTRAASAARRAIRASVGPILPATPSTTTSPPTVASRRPRRQTARSGAPRDGTERPGNPWAACLANVADVWSSVRRAGLL